LKCLPYPTHWTKALPLVLLGIHTTLKQDLKCTSAELVYSTTLCLPGEFIVTDNSNTNTLDPTSYVTQLRTVMKQLCPKPACRQQQQKTHISTDLSTCPYVFVRHDGVKKSLQPPYDGPFHVLKRDTKHYTLDIAGHKQVVSLDRLKPAYTDNSSTSDITAPTDSLLEQNTATDHLPSTSALSTTTTPTTPRTTRSGHHVHWPKRLSDYRMFT